MTNDKMQFHSSWLSNLASLKVTPEEMRNLATILSAQHQITVHNKGEH